jgi:hypothetical protein
MTAGLPPGADRLTYSLPGGIAVHLAEDHQLVVSVHNHRAVITDVEVLRQALADARSFREMLEWRALPVTARILSGTERFCVACGRDRVIAGHRYPHAAGCVLAGSTLEENLGWAVAKFNDGCARCGPGKIAEGSLIRENHGKGWLCADCAVQDLTVGEVAATGLIPPQEPPAVTRAVTATPDMVIVTDETGVVPGQPAGGKSVWNFDAMIAKAAGPGGPPIRAQVSDLPPLPDVWYALRVDTQRPPCRYCTELFRFLDGESVHKHRDGCPGRPFDPDTDVPAEDQP